MVNHGRVELLAHPLSQKYLEMKWNSYGKYFHLATLLFYCVFLSFVTIFSSSLMNLEDTGNSTNMQSRILFSDIDLSDIMKKTNGDKRVEGNELNYSIFSNSCKKIFIWVHYKYDFNGKVNTICIVEKYYCSGKGFVAEGIRPASRKFWVRFPVAPRLISLLCVFLIRLIVNIILIISS